MYLLAKHVFFCALNMLLAGEGAGGVQVKTLVKTLVKKHNHLASQDVFECSYQQYQQRLS
jgi:hypothetical protein